MKKIKNIRNTLIINQKINNLKAQIKTLIDISKQIFLLNLAKVGKHEYKH